MIGYIKNITNNFIFWFHIIFIVWAILSGLFFSTAVVFAFIVLHRLHIIIFDGCLISKIHNWTGGLPKNMNFLQLVASKIFQKNISLAQSRRLDYFFVGLSLIISFII